MRRTILTAVLGLALIAPAQALATTVTASHGGVTATLSYSDGPGITTKDERLTITQTGEPAYDESVPAKGCLKVCSPEGKRPVQVVSVEGSHYQQVVLNLFTGGADCCAIVQVYAESAAIPGDWNPVSHNFGEDGAVLKDIGPAARPEFVSGDPAFYCEFSPCYASALPIQIFEFTEAAFVDVTKQHPALVGADAGRWLKLYDKNPGQGLGALAAWAADEDNLGLQATVRTVLQRQAADGHLKAAFVSSLQRFLTKHGYT